MKLFSLLHVCMFTCLCVFTCYRPSDLRLRNISNQGMKRPSPSPTRRISQPNPPAPGYGGSPVRARRGSNPSTPTGNIYKPISEQAPSNSAVLLANHADPSSGQPVLNDISLTPTRYPRPRLRDDYSHAKHNKKRNIRHYCLKRGNSLSLSRQRDYSSETELKIIEENIVSWGTIRAVQASMKNHGHNSIDVKYPSSDNEMAEAGYRTCMHKTHGINDDKTLARSIDTDSFIPMHNIISVHGLDSTQVKQHRAANYMSCLSQFHHGSLNRTYLEDYPLLSLGNEHDRLYHASIFSRFLVNQLLLFHERTCLVILGKIQQSSSFP